MVLHVALTHATTYRYDKPIGMGPQVIRLRPAPHCRTPILSYSLTLEPKVHFLNWQQDPFGNFLGRVVMPEPTTVFSVTVDLVADMAVINPFDFFVEESAQTWPFAYDPLLAKELSPYLSPDPVGPMLGGYMAGIDRSRSLTTIDFLIALNQRLRGDVSYLIRMEPGVQSPEATLANRSGSCRDSAWLLVQILRNLGLAARFVSGYLIQLKPDVTPRGGGAAGSTTDFTDLHAWAEVYLPGAGWIGLDATSGLLAGEGHIPLAATPHPLSAAPISGSHGAASVTFDFNMAVTRLTETPRVTKPYSEETWQNIFATGQAVDKLLADGDVRLSMGGEPTFVAADDMEGAEWNTAAVGPDKRRYADELIRRMQARLAPGGLLHYGQGKWYPGEPLPRWAFSLYWRADGEPLWRDRDLIAREDAKTSATIAQAAAFAAELCRRLGLAPTAAFEAFEDASLLLLSEQKQPLGEAQDAANVEDEAERQRLARALDRGLTEPVAYVLPLKASKVEGRKSRWVTERWRLRRDKLVLIPGDSAAGFRLPLNSLPPLTAEEYPHVQPLDPMSSVPPLPDHDDLASPESAAAATPDHRAHPAEPIEAVRTALAIEPRDGRLNVFVPPLESVDDYATLIALIEESARVVGVPVHVEGYGPPYDPRLSVLRVTPDPGVVEVNVQPASTWGDIVAHTTALYDDAEACGLIAEKFMLDGRHAGTGGGNHIVIGGLTPADSPFLRRPDLLASIIAYWQNHPALSYLFSGLFIGPTSQAPRADEGRPEAVYELEIALSQIPAAAGSVAPWLVDRLFRNLLIDVTGNTHRAEICVDKLYSPDSPTGRLGLVEFRSFEMPPHARMSLAQQLLVRALIAMFWNKPYRQKLVRWGTALHDRFMLPHYLWADLASISEDLRAAGLPVDVEWFRPHLEFRFPRFGAIEHANVQLELRQAIEPWHVLGEESSTGGTARYVDSSLERVQVKVTGLYGDRLTVTCNGRTVPLAPTGVQGEAVAGIRYRAWCPPSALHPNIEPHVPLAIDIYDTYSGRALAGCRYHVSHPGGRNFETFPINAYEAEGRRLARFEVLGHSAGAYEPRPAPVNLDYPHTLDLRRQA